MQEVLNYIRNYARNEDKQILFLCSLQTAILIFLNYQFNLESWLITNKDIPWPRFTGHLLIFIIAFGLPYLFYALKKKKNYFNKKDFVTLMLLACGIFALKMSVNT